jgi:hypothetical protein
MAEQTPARALAGRLTAATNWVSPDRPKPVGELEQVLKEMIRDARAVARFIRVHEGLTVRTEIELVPFGSLSHSGYKSKLVEPFAVRLKTTFG